MRASGCFDIDLALAERTDLGGLGSVFFFLANLLGCLVHSLDDKEYHDGHEKEVDDCGDENADGHRQ